MATRLLFLCLARDCAETFPNFVAMLDDLELAGFDCNAIIGENGSRDNTRELIEHGAPRLKLFDTSFMELEPSRLRRMAMGREALLEEGRKRSTDFVVVADLDDAMRSPPKAICVNIATDRFKYRPWVFAVAATSWPTYYDLLALAADGVVVASLREIEEAKRRPWSYYWFQKRRIYEMRKAMTTGCEFTVASAFNGFAIYDGFDYFLGSYRSADEEEVCEHVSLNDSIARKTGKSMMIVPELSIRAPHEHTPVGFVRFWWDRIRKRRRLAFP